jgi:parallel beta-helix repeat protein
MAKIKNSRILRIMPLVIAVCLICVPVQAKYGGGSGTAEDPYQIATAEDIILLGESPEDYDKHFILTADIDLDPNLPGRKVFDKAVIAPDVNAAEGGFQGTPFTGVFGGNVHTVSHLMIKGGGYVGLFSQWASDARANHLDVVSILDPNFGAMGDGRDDSDAIQKAIDSGASCVIIPKGTFYVGKALRLRSHLTLSGHGDSTIKLVDNAKVRGGLLVAYGGRLTDISLENFTVDGNRTKNIDHGPPASDGNEDRGYVGLLALINVTQVTNLSLHRMKVVNSWDSGIWVSDCENVSVTGCMISDCRSSGLAIRNVPEMPGTSSNVIIQGNTCSGGVVGIHVIFGCWNVSLVGNKCFNNRDQNRFVLGYSGTYPNVWPSSPGFKSSSSDGYKSPAKEGDGAGIELTGVHTLNGAVPNTCITVSNNLCHQNMVGIRSEEDTCYVSIVGNACHNNDTDGVFIFSSRFCSVGGNQCISNGRHGINIQKLSKKVFADAVRPEQIAVTGNICRGNDLFGIALQGAWQCTINGNTCSGNDVRPRLSPFSPPEGGGVGLLSVDDLRVKLCTIVGNLFVSYDDKDRYGIYSDSDGHANNVISNNIFYRHKISATNINRIRNTVVDNRGD